MNERMSNVEIEDVLSSIRKLVSEDLRPAAAPAPVATAPRSGAPRLVLTPALRVDVPAAAADAVVAGEPDPQPRPVLPEPAALESRLAEIEALLDATRDAFEPDGGDVLMPDPWPAQDEAEAPFITDIDDEPDHRLGASQPAPVMAAEPAPDAPAAVADTSENRHTAEAPEAAGFEDDPDATAQDDALPMLDEAVLRELIRDVLREELQGVMGERVTRNLRKLVRAEIARALLARGIA